MKIKFNYKQFDIGDYVIVNRIMFRISLGDKKKWIPLPSLFSSRLGQVVGITIKYDGTVGYGAFDEGGYYFNPSKSHQFWLVRFGLSNKAVCVDEKDVRLARSDEIHPLPYKYHQRKISEQDKQYFSEESKKWPRDAKGRWAKM